MKYSGLALLSLLASAVIARPSTKDEEGDPLPQTSRVTAFVIDDNGNPSVECWEYTNMTNDGINIQRKDGSTARAYSVNIAKRGELEGLDILTWPAASPIWPDPSTIDSGASAQWLDLSQTFNLFNVQGGLVNFRFSVFAQDQAARELPEHTFSLENGDDWFYFEDKYSNSDQALRADAAAPSFAISTISATETEVMRLRFPQRPKYKVLHKGGCSFTGVSTPADSSSKRQSRAHHSLLQKQSAEL